MLEITKLQHCLTDHHKNWHINTCFFYEEDFYDIPKCYMENYLYINGNINY